jgi:type II secretory pathway predicted ATPase ExeA
MLAHYFGFAEDPFGATPDPRYLYSSLSHREALASLHYAFYSNRGFTALIARPGMGKTTLLFEFLRHIRETARSAFLFNCQTDPTDLLRSVLREIGVAPQESLGQILEQLHKELVETARAGKRFVVIVDEAQSLTEPALETLRMLTNFETPRAKLMQIVLSGQPELEDKLARPSLDQLRQRISTFCRLEPFSREDSIAYIEHRLKVAGHTGDSVFAVDALDCIAEASGGIPRIINTLCFNALSLCCSLKQTRVEMAMVTEAIHDLQLTSGAATQKNEVPRLELWDGHAPESRRRERLWAKIRVPAFSLLLLLALGLAVGANRVFQKLSIPKRLFVAAPTATAPRPAEKPGADLIEVTVDAKQTVSEIAVNKLGSFDDEVLRQIENLNPGLKDPNLIHPGEKILLPRHATPLGGGENLPDPNLRKRP